MCIARDNRKGIELYNKSGKLYHERAATRDLLRYIKTKARRREEQVQKMKEVLKSEPGSQCVCGCGGGQGKMEGGGGRGKHACPPRGYNAVRNVQSFMSFSIRYFSAGSRQRGGAQVILLSVPGLFLSEGSIIIYPKLPRSRPCCYVWHKIRGQLPQGFRKKKNRNYHTFVDPPLPRRTTVGECTAKITDENDSTRSLTQFRLHVLYPHPRARSSVNAARSFRCL